MPSHLIDVRTPAEFSTGALPNAINIEYQNIDSLINRDGVGRNDAITLYCRSGRRSAVAMERLRELGFGNVRDVGGMEAAREVLRWEREGEEELGGEEMGGVDAKGKEGQVKEGGKEGREESFARLMDGLKEGE